jgi:hypothetical protein
MPITIQELGHLHYWVKFGGPQQILGKIERSFCHKIGSKGPRDLKKFKLSVMDCRFGLSIVQTLLEPFNMPKKKKYVKLNC